MTPGSRLSLCAFVLTGALIASFALSQTSEPEGHVTTIFHDVQLLPEKAEARPAVMNDKVDDGSALRTGDDSRSELTFADLTITRLGANTVFSFNKAGRSVRLDSGAILLYARKNSGGATISTKAVSVGITGTTVIFESRADRYDRLIVLEGDTRCWLNDFPDQATDVRPGQLLNVKAGSKKLPKPGRVDLRRIMNTHPLIKNFPPLPSLDLILAVADGRNPNRPPPQPVSGGTGSQGGPSPVYVPTGPSLGPTTLWWCCFDGQVVQSTEAECRARGGQAFRSEQEARKACGRKSPTPTPTPHGGELWCCVDGKVVQATPAQSRARSIQCYGSREEALKNCSPKQTTCWCCINGQVVQTTEADCGERDGQCYGSRKEARKNCRGAGATPTPTPHRSYPTPRPTPRSTIGRPNYPKPTPTPTPKKRYPPIKRARPTPPPGQIIR
ncbi:MAG: hypothetical protein QOE81_961 [Verrucomicrobiota bacterium]